MNEEQNNINKIFDLLDEWRNFPAYQLERRADIFFALYLPRIINDKFGLEDEDVDILPEFPVRIGSITNIPINKSFKIDYLVVCRQKKKVFLVELKTDLLSRRTKQDDYLQKAKEINVTGLIIGLLKIYHASEQKKKYRNYLEKLVELGWLIKENDEFRDSSMNYDIDIVYIQPCVKGDDQGKVITFDDIINSLSLYLDPLTKRFVKSLEEWKHNPN